MEKVREELKNLDELIGYIENDLIGAHEEIKLIDDGIKMYAESYHKMKLKLESKQSTDWEKLIEKFFKECVHEMQPTGTAFGVKFRFKLNPNQIVEWFKRELG